MASDPKVAQAVAEAEAVARTPVAPEITARASRASRHASPVGSEPAELTDGAWSQPVQPEEPGPAEPTT